MSAAAVAAAAPTIVRITDRVHVTVFRARWSGNACIQIHGPTSETFSVAEFSLLRNYRQRIQACDVELYEWLQPDLVIDLSQQECGGLMVSISRVGVNVGGQRRYVGDITLRRTTFLQLLDQADDILAAAVDIMLLPPPRLVQAVAPFQRSSSASDAGDDDFRRNGDDQLPDILLDGPAKLDGVKCRQRTSEAQKLFLLVVLQTLWYYVSKVLASRVPLDSSHRICLSDVIDASMPQTAQLLAYARQIDTPRVLYV